MLIKMLKTYAPDSEWQFLSPGWTFSCDEKDGIFEWRLKDFGPEALRLCYDNGVFQIKANKGWAFVQEEFLGHIEMHLWSKKQGVALADPRVSAIEIALPSFEAESQLGKYELEKLVASITQNIQLTQLFYSINEYLSQHK